LTETIAASDALIRALPTTAIAMINIDRVIPRVLLVSHRFGASGDGLITKSLSQHE
jgi:hypothetical protein